MILNGDIPSNLTFEQFKALAMREPDVTGNWLYELASTEYDNEDENMYPQFELGLTTRYLFTRLEDAERFMRERLAAPSIYNFIITQLPLGVDVSEHGAKWLYDSTGKLLDRTTTHWIDSDGLDSIYFGPAREPRFHRGDIVEVWGRDKKVNLAIVLHEPNPLEWYWERYQKHGKDYYFDSSDEEMYYLLEGPGYMHHDHAGTLSLMPTRRPVADDIRRYFEHCAEHADDEDCEEVFHTAYYSDTDAGLLGENKIVLLYDESSKRHRLAYIVDNPILSDNDRRMVLPGTLNETQLERLKRFLSEVMYGKPRLWYLIRDWNEYHRFDGLEPVLSPDSTIEELLS